MGFLSMLVVASMPIIQVLLIGVIGAFLASGYSKVLTASARRDMNKVVFTVFTPSLIFASLAKTVTLSDVISWWFMPVNIAITFLVGSTLGWIACKILKPPQHFRGLIIAFCSSGNLGNLLLIVVPAVCDEDGNPFGEDRSQCRSRGLSYSSLSMALGGLFIWTYTYSLMQKAGKIYHKMQSKSIQCPADSDEEHLEQFKVRNGSARDDEEAALPTSARPEEHDDRNQIEAPLLSCESDVADKGFWTRLKEAVHQLVEELMAPPTISAMIGFVVGLVPCQQHDHRWATCAYRPKAHEDTQAKPTQHRSGVEYLSTHDPRREASKLDQANGGGEPLSHLALILIPLPAVFPFGTLVSVSNPQTIPVIELRIQYQERKS